MSCSKADCARTARYKSLCDAHYQQELRKAYAQEIDPNELWEYVKKELKIA